MEHSIFLAKLLGVILVVGPVVKEVRRKPFAEACASSDVPGPRELCVAQEPPASRCRRLMPASFGQKTIRRPSLVDTTLE